jgi:hypothetical protein
MPVWKAILTIKKDTNTEKVLNRALHPPLAHFRVHADEMKTPGNHGYLSVDAALSRQWEISEM